jgi:glycosyltransferase involved in cell wall biosynthesis
MKIAFLCSEYPKISHTFILREVEALRRRGLEVETFSIRRTPAQRLLAAADREAAASTTAILPPRWRSLLGAHLRALTRSPAAYFATLSFALGMHAPGLRGRLWQLFYFVEAIFLWNECRRRGIRHVHAHLANAAADLAMVAAEFGNRADAAAPWSWSFTMHGPTEFFDLRHYRLAEKLASARFVVCISDFARSQLMAISDPARWNDLHVIHVGLPVEEFTRISPPSVTGEDPRLLYIGRLVPEKGQTVLFEAVARLAERGRGVRLTLAGEGEIRPRLEELAAELGIADRVEFLGAVGQDTLREIYAGAAVFCLPSFAEGVPVVLMEAMAMEVPVITTKIAGIPELVEDGRSGLLVAPGRADELAEALERLLADPELAARLGRQGREKVVAEFDCERSAAQLYALFAELEPRRERAGSVSKVGA